MKFVKFPKITNLLPSLLGSGLFLSIGILPSLAKTFEPPSFDGRYIDACVKSPRYSDGCNEQAYQVAANAFCRQMGMTKATDFVREFKDWKNRVQVWQLEERFVQGPSGQSRVRLKWNGTEGGNYFESIDCQ